MKWSASLCFSAYEALPLDTGTVRLPLAAGRPVISVIVNVGLCDVWGESSRGRVSRAIREDYRIVLRVEWLECFVPVEEEVIVSI